MVLPDGLQERTPALSFSYFKIWPLQIFQPFPETS